MKSGARVRLLSHSAHAVLVLLAAGVLVPDCAGAMERREKPVVTQPARDLDAEVAAAQEDVRRAADEAQSKRRAGGVELRAAQKDLVQARERLQALRVEADDRRVKEEQRQFAEKQRQDRESEAVRQAELVRQQQEGANRLAEDERLRKERKEAERQRTQDALQERFRRMDEIHNRRAAAEAAELTRQWREQQREQAKPKNVLTRLYASYIQVKRCHTSLAGQAFVYVDDRELAAARDQTKFVEGKLIGADPELDREAAWQAANERDPAEVLFKPGPQDVEAGVLSERGQELCRGALVAVKEQYLGYNPDAAIVKKDF